jgi:hypothetical protein
VIPGVDRTTANSKDKDNEDGDMSHSGNTSLFQSNRICVVGAVAFSRSHQYVCEAMWRHDEGAHLVRGTDSAYGWSPNKNKFGWLVSDIWTLEQTEKYISESSSTSNYDYCKANNVESIGKGVVRGNESENLACDEGRGCSDRQTSDHSGGGQRLVLERVFRSLFRVEAQCC